MATILSTMSSKSWVLVANKPGGSQALATYRNTVEWIIAERQEKLACWKLQILTMYHLTLCVFMTVNEYTMTHMISYHLTHTEYKMQAFPQ